MDSMDKRRFSSTDMISNLDEHLIDQILSLLPIEEAVRTSILSRSWRYRWTTMTVLNFNDQFLDKFSRNGPFDRNGSMRIINKVMSSHNGPILKFHLDIPDIPLGSFQEVDQWMLILSRNNVRELVIINLNEAYPLPSHVFSCMELKSLGLYNCIFKPPIGFKGFPNLERACLGSTYFGRNFDGTVIDLPQLSMLELYKCSNVSNFNINAGNLGTLLVSTNHLDPMPLDAIFNLTAMLSKFPNIVSFTIAGYFLKFLAVEEFSKLLPHKLDCLSEMEFRGFTFSDLDQLQGALCMLRNSPNLKVLLVTNMPMGWDGDMELSCNYLESPDCLHQTLLTLENVEITSLEGSRPELLFIKLLLDHSPHLENIIIRPSATTDAEQRLNIAKDVMLFPRASSKAKILYLDPEP